MTYIIQNSLETKCYLSSRKLEWNKTWHKGWLSAALLLFYRRWHPWQLASTPVQLLILRVTPQVTVNIWRSNVCNLFVQRTRFSPIFSDKPRCVHSSPMTVAVSKASTNLIPCDCQGIPKATTFRWVLNSSGIEETLRQRTSTLTLSHTRLMYPVGRKEMGTLKCWATNTVGKSEEPCIFQLVAAGKKEFRFCKG